jgi:small redox-active disulfide protein 2
VKRVQIVGPGCARCEALARNAEAAACELGIDYKLTKVTDYPTMVELGVMMTPAIVIDKEVKASGRVLSVEEIKKILRD